jgi:hypothetical protein
VLVQEGAMADWTAVYLRDVARTGPGLAASGYAGFSATMALGRAGETGSRSGSAPSGWCGGRAAAALGVAVAVLAPGPAPRCWASAGGRGARLRVSGRARGRQPGAGRRAGRGIALVSTMGYTGFLAGPPLIGFVAEAATLRSGPGVVGGAGVLVALLAGVLRGTDGAGPARPRGRQGA